MSMEEIWCSICRGRGSCQRNTPGVSHSRFLASEQWFSDTVQQCRDYKGWASKSSPDVKDLRNVKLHPPFAAASHRVFVSRRNCNRKHLDAVCIGIILYDFSLLFFSRRTVLWYFFFISNDINVFLVQPPLPAVQANAEFLVHMLNLRWWDKRDDCRRHYY